jgi:agmatinase
MFPGARTARNGADYAIVGAPLDISTSFQPGARFGPDRLRRFARGFDDYDQRTDQLFTDLAVHDGGNERAWDTASEYLSFLEGTVSDLQNEEIVPILIGGEHTVSVAGVRATAPDVYVCLDAHLDLRTEYAGNPLSHATVTHHALAVADEVVVLGARTGSSMEWERACEPDVTVVPPDEVGKWQPTFDKETEVYLSVDIDCADPAYAPGTGTMEPYGLTGREMRDLVRAVAPSATAFDVVEVNDQDDGQAATLAAKLLREFVYTHAATHVGV